ncbi:MAG TPA: YhjD/YihY/BrkB family envelope integrity protein [Polyangiaceae bacterium]|nr:YhjD/YihY/BrkB family envelope integrity protein [Polyangiaceae bacterium]
MRKLPQPLAEVVSGVGRRRTLGLAAEMSFWVFLSLMPLLAVGGFVAARVATAHPWTALSAMQAVPPPVRELVMKEADHIASWHGGAVAPIAAATFLWLASTGVAAIFDALELQSGAQPRPWLRKRMLAIGTCIALAAGGALIGLLESGVAWLERVAGANLPSWLVSVVHGPAGRIARFFVGAVMAITMVAGLYRVGVPRGEGTRPRVLGGAVVAVMLMVALGYAYGFYVTKLGGSGSVYEAGLAAVGMTLMTLWLFSIALLLGAQLNCVLAERLRAGGAWHRSAASSSPRTSPRPPSAQSTPRSSSQPASARR